MSKYANCTDEQLLTLTKQGDSVAEEYLLDKYKTIVRKKARAMYLVGGETDDLIQEGMLGLFKAVRDYQTGREASFATFASLCIDRQIYNAIQSSNRKKHGPLNSYISLSDEEFELELRQVSEQTPETIVIGNEQAKGLRETIQKNLSAFENEVLKSYLAGNDYVQIASLLDKEPKAIDNALQRIRTKVKGCLSKEK